ncbi:hypothetical protein [Otoolea muris]|uniref:hypothetical protein n=1 Tax=Otoolea muris TaxID=2941515 RepID=UPI00203B010D|nr:hypothetical protein [Otoolea muris]
MKSTIHINQRLSLSERLIVVFLLVLSFENIIEYYSGSKIGIAVLIYRIIAAGYAVFCFFLCVRSKYKRNSYSTAELLLFIFIFMWSVLCLLFHGVEKDFFTGVIYFGILAGGILTQKRFEIWERLLSVIPYLGVAVMVLMIATQHIDLTVAIRRGYVWTNIFFWGGIYWALIPVVLYSFLNRKKRGVAVAYWICGIIFNLIFLKRFIIVDSALLLFMVLYILYKENRSGGSRLTRIGVFILCIGLTACFLLQNSFLYEMTKQMFQRMDFLSSIWKFDRVIESRSYFCNESFIYTLLGRGFWGAHSTLGTLNPALHIGWSNFIFKGGIALFILAVFPVIKSYKSLFKLEHYDREYKFAVCCVVIYSVKLLYVNLHRFEPELILFFWACTVIMEKTGKKIMENANSEQI